MDILNERGPMKLKHLAAFVMLLALGCAKQPGGDTKTPAPESAPKADAAETSHLEPETQTLATVSFDVTGMK